MPFQRPIADVLRSRLDEEPKRIQIVAGPRQVGKSTLIRQLMAQRSRDSYRIVAADPQSLPSRPIFADPVQATSAPLPPSPEWLQLEWQIALQKALAWETERTKQRSEDPASFFPSFVLIVDEIQKVSQWSSYIKGYWDSAQANRVPMHLVLLGSSPLLIQEGLVESLAGRYELIRLAQWSYAEMHEAFGLTLDEYIHFGGYPGAAHLIRDEMRWRDYVRHSIVEPSIGRDILTMTRVDKPALLRQLFELAAAYSGQIVSLDKMSGQLGQGHTLTLAENLSRLRQAGLMSGLRKHAGQQLRQRESPPKLQAHDNAFLTVMQNYGFDEARADRGHWGRKIESTVGAHLLNTADSDTTIFYWRERDKEVDFVISRRGRLAAIEVKQSAGLERHAGLDAFCAKYPGCRRWVIGTATLPLGLFLNYPAAHWTTAEP